MQAFSQSGKVRNISLASGLLIALAATFSVQQINAQSGAMLQLPWRPRGVNSQNT